MAKTRAMARSALRTRDGYIIDMTRPIETPDGIAYPVRQVVIARWALRYLRGRK